MKSRRVHRSATLLSIVLWLTIQPALAQDAQQALALSVSYTTLKNSTTVSEERRKEIDAIEAKARAAARDRKYGEAMGHYYHAMAMLRGQEWTPDAALTAAARMKADRLIYDPGDVAHLQLSQIFPLEEPLAGPFKGAILLTRVVDRTSQVLRELKQVSGVPTDFIARPFTVDVTIPTIDDGAYQLTLSLKTPSNRPIVKSAPIQVLRGVTADTQALLKRVQTLESNLRSRGQSDALRMLAPVVYSLSLLDLANRGQINAAQLDMRAELASTASLFETVSKGKNPLLTKTGDFHWAYRSTVDNELQPYRIYVPTSFDASKTYPLVVALHGMNGDENGMFANYGDGIIKKEAEARGYIVVCPKGRGSASMYRGDAEQDVIDVLNEVRRDYRIDSNRTYLMGHSMGGYGTWSVAMNHPSEFAAIAPISGGGQPAGLNKIVGIPELVIHGDNDPTVNVSESRRMVEAAKALGIEVKYIEVPGGTHSSVVAPHIKHVFDWFDTHTRNIPVERP